MSHLDTIADEIRAHLEDIEARLKEFDELRDHQRRLQKALATLQDQETRKEPAKKRSSRNVWRPAKGNIEATMAVLAAADKPLSVTKIADEMQRSREVVRRSIEVLRDEGRVRMAGSGGRNVKLFAAMPEEQKPRGGARNGRTA